MSLALECVFRRKMKLHKDTFNTEHARDIRIQSEDVVPPLLKSALVRFILSLDGGMPPDDDAQDDVAFIHWDNAEIEYLYVE